LRAVRTTARQRDIAIISEETPTLRITSASKTSTSVRPFLDAKDLFIKTTGNHPNSRGFNKDKHAPLFIVRISGVFP